MNSNLAAARRHSTYRPINRDHKRVTLGLSRYKSCVYLGIFTNLGFRGLKLPSRERARLMDPVRAPLSEFSNKKIHRVRI